MDFFQIYFKGLLLIVFLMTLLWLLSVYLKNVSIVDAFWGIGFVILAIHYFLTTPSNELHPRKVLLVAWTGIWGIRLSFYLLIRNWGKPEDFRYQKFRKDYGAHRYWWYSFFQVFLLQGIWGNWKRPQQSPYCCVRKWKNCWHTPNNLYPLFNF